MKHSERKRNNYWIDEASSKENCMASMPYRSIQE
jgi:hypothetical protein